MLVLNPGFFMGAVNLSLYTETLFLSRCSVAAFIQKSSKISSCVLSESDNMSFWESALMFLAKSLRIYSEHERNFLFTLSASTARSQSSSFERASEHTSFRTFACARIMRKRKWTDDYDVEDVRVSETGSYLLYNASARGFAVSTQPYYIIIDFLIVGQWRERRCWEQIPFANCEQIIYVGDDDELK